MTPLREAVMAAAARGDHPPSGDLVLHLIRRFALMQGLPAEGLIEAACRAHAVSIPHKSALFHEGEAAVSYTILYAGRVKLTQRTPAGAQVLVRVVGEGQACAWPGIFADGAYLASASTLEPSRALVWPRGELEELFDQFPVLSRSALRVLTRHQRGLEDRYRELASERVPQRLARTILRVVQPRGRRFEDGWLANVPLSQHDLAQLAGTTLFTVSRLLGRWEKAGVLKARREHVVIEDPRALAELLGRDPADRVR
jgi:CRP-like cAMP-binding protein